jgi:hypothetical protein
VDAVELCGGGSVCEGEGGAEAVLLLLTGCGGGCRVLCPPGRGLLDRGVVTSLELSQA